MLQDEDHGDNDRDQEQTEKQQADLGVEIGIFRRQVDNGKSSLWPLGPRARSCRITLREHLPHSANFNAVI